MATLRAIPMRACDRCKRRATHKLLSERLLGHGYFCLAHGRVALVELRAKEDEREVLALFAPERSREASA